jgi:hypothetical protein
MRVCVNTNETKWDNCVVAHETTWDTFRDVILSGHVVADDRLAVKLFNACEYKTPESLAGDPKLVVYDGDTDRTYTRRLKENVLTVTMLILDYDGGMSLNDAREKFKAYEYVGYTSFRHLKDKGVEKFRLVFPLATPVPAVGKFTDCDDLIEGADWYELGEALKEFSGACDPASFRCNQFYYLPIAPKSRVEAAQVWFNSGIVLDWSSWRRSPQQKYVSPSGQDASLDRRSTNRRLHPNQLLESHSGTFRVRDVAHRVEGVWCPFHDDKNGSEFVDRVKNGGVYIFCRRCNETFWMLRRWEINRPQELPAFVEMDEQPRHAEFTDASDRTRVNEQLQEIGISIARGNARLPPGADIAYQHPTHLVYLPEGTGKSALAFDLAAGGMKILFACKSLEQVFEKYEWFKAKAKRHVKEASERLEMLGVLGGEVTPPRQAPVNVQLFLSKGAKALARFGVDAVRQPPKNPFDAGRIDDDASIQAFKAANPNLSEEFIRLSWHFFAPDRLHLASEPYPGDEEGELDEVLSGSEKFKTADIIVTTFAQIRLLRVRNHQLSWDWTVWVDDPDVNDFADIEPYEPERWGELSEEEQETAGIVSRQATGQRYYRRDHRQSMGAAVRRHRCVYTTTERVTLKAAKKLLQDRRENIVVHDKMEGVSGGKITLLGTDKVYSSYDGIIPLMVRRLEKGDHDVRLIADGLGQSLNHSNSKGKNNLRERNLVVELSSPHPLKVKTICDAIGLTFETEGGEIGKDLLLDQLHQALGRNSGYRYAGRECVALVPANMHSRILQEVRYAYDESNSVLIDRLAEMSRKDRRTQENASPLVLAIEQFLNNFPAYIQDKRKVVPDVTYVISNIKDPGDRLAYASRLLHALTTFSNIRLDKTPTDAELSQPLYEHYRAVADTVLENFPTDTERNRVLALYTRRLDDEMRREVKRREDWKKSNNGVPEGFLD